MGTQKDDRVINSLTPIVDTKQKYVNGKRLNSKLTNRPHELVRKARKKKWA